MSKRPRRDELLWDKSKGILQGFSGIAIVGALWLGMVLVVVLMRFLVVEGLGSSQYRSYTLP